MSESNRAPRPVTHPAPSKSRPLKLGLPAPPLSRRYEPHRNLLFFLGLDLLLLLGDVLLVTLHCFHGQIHKFVGGTVVAPFARCNYEGKEP